MKKRCEICGMEANPDLKREFEGEIYYFHTDLCMITFDIQLEKIIVERNGLLEESRRSLGLSRFHLADQVSEAVMAHRQHVFDCACNVLSHNEVPDKGQPNNGGYNDNV